IDHDHEGAALVAIAPAADRVAEGRGVAIEGGDELRPGVAAAAHVEGVYVQAVQARHEAGLQQRRLAGPRWRRVHDHAALEDPVDQLADLALAVVERRLIRLPEGAEAAGRGPLARRRYEDGR